MTDLAVPFLPTRAPSTCPGARRRRCGWWPHSHVDPAKRCRRCWCSPGGRTRTASAAGGGTIVGGHGRAVRSRSIRRGGPPGAGRRFEAELAAFAACGAGQPAVGADAGARPAGWRDDVRAAGRFHAATRRSDIEFAQDLARRCALAIGTTRGSTRKRSAAKPTPPGPNTARDVPRRGRRGVWPVRSTTTETLRDGSAASPCRASPTGAPVDMRRRCRRSSGAWR